MTQTATKKPIPNTNELAFLHTASKILVSRIHRNDDIHLSNPWQDTAEELLLAIQEDGEQGFWKTYEALYSDHARLRDWRGIVETAAPPDEDASKIRTYQLHPISYLRNLPKRKWAVDHILLDKGLSAFVGDGGSGKTTFKFDLDIARACGINFIGRETSPAFVIWVAGESIDELYDRAIAMLKCNGLSEDALTNFLILDGAMPFNNTAEVNTFIEEVQAQLDERGVTPQSHSISFTFDTYARCTPGADENSTQDTKMIVDSMLKVSNTFSAQVSIIHHTNAKGTIRGNTAFRDALDTMWNVTKEDGKITLVCDKMRGKETPAPFQVEMRSILLDPDDLDCTAPVIFSAEASNTEVLTPRVQLQILEILRESGSLASNEWYRRCEKAYKTPYTTWNNHKKALEDAGLVEVPQDVSRGQKKMYTATTLGEERLG